LVAIHFPTLRSHTNSDLLHQEIYLPAIII